MAVATLVPASTQRAVVACHICSSTDDTTYIEARGYRIARCKNCALWFVNSQPTGEELRQFYATLTRNSSRRFDVIALLNVLQHLTRSAETLLQLDQLLVSDGVLAIVVPDARLHDLVGRVPNLFGISDPFWIERPKSFLSRSKLPDHLCSFQPGTITSLLRRCGFQIIAIENAPVVFNSTLRRTAAKLLVFWMSRALHFFTFRRLLVGYSTLVFARKVLG